MRTVSAVLIEKNTGWIFNCIIILRDKKMAKIIKVAEKISGFFLESPKDLRSLLCVEITKKIEICIKNDNNYKQRKIAFNS